MEANSYGTAKLLKWLSEARGQMNRHGKEYPVKLLCYEDFVAVLELATEAASARENPVPLCDGHAASWFTERNHLKGGMDATCVVCAHQPTPESGRSAVIDECIDVVCELEGENLLKMVQRLRALKHGIGALTMAADEHKSRLDRAHLIKRLEAIADWINTPEDKKALIQASWALSETEPRGSYENGWNECLDRALLAVEGEQAKYTQEDNPCTKPVRGALEYAMFAMRGLRVPK